MIIQELKQGIHKIRIETAENLEDAKKNKFLDGEYVRYFIDNKKVKSYMHLISFITKEAKTNQSNLISDTSNLMKMKQKMFDDRNNEIKKQVEDLKIKYSKMGLSEDIVKSINQKLDAVNIGINDKKVDPVTNVRIKQ